jgi:hypothetical protein
MIGRSEWFGRRKYGGWGLSPKSWQGWAYIAAIALIAFGLQNIDLTITYIFLAIMCLDLLHIMATLKKDEMEVRIEALAERNASWAMISIIAIGVAFQSAQAKVDWFLIAALAVGVIAKAITNFWLEKKGI